MSTEIVNVTPLETCSAKVGLMVMESIILDGYIERQDTFGAHDQKKKVEAMMKTLDCVELSEALYFYEKATGKLGQSTYLR